MTAGPQLTAPQRAAAVDRIGESLALLSGAGCGKTLVLATRYAELLKAARDGETALSRFVALTFTEKAALEMSGRVRKLLAEAAQAASGEERRRLLGWLEELPEGRISTIHGFCASLLRTHAIEAGIDPGFVVCADELLANHLVNESADQAVLDAVEHQRDDVAALLAELPFERVVELVAELLDNRTACDLASYADPAATMNRWAALAAQDRARALAELKADRAIADEAAALAAWRCPDPHDRLVVFRDEQMKVVQSILADPDLAAAEMFPALAAKPGNVGSANNWGGKEALLEIRARLRTLIEAVQEYALYFEELGDADRRAAERLATLSKLAVEAGALYSAAKRRRGMLDFTDLLDFAERLLRDRPEVCKSLASQIDQLLIDECQDTNAFQLQLLGRLVGGRAGAAPPRGRLFVVGDAKQSIYRFRGAQVEVFQSLCKRMGPANREHLDTSFRTHEAGIAFVNHLFAPLMGEDYEPVAAHRQRTPPRPSVEIILAADEEDRPVEDSAAATAVQAAATADRVRRMLDDRERIVWDRSAGDWRPVRCGDIAILFARMTNSLDYERELQRRLIPYYVVAGTGFFQQQEVFDVLNALRAVDDPFDDIALMGVLRGSLFGLDDNALMHVAESCEAPYFAALSRGAAVGGLDEARADALRQAAGLIGRLHARKDAVAIDALLAELLAETGYEATLLSQFQGKRMLGNVRRVLDQARAVAGEGVALADFLDQMQELVINESRYEQAVVAGEAEDVVRLMTIHKAKGLEFPVVIVPDLNAGRRGRSGRLLIRSDWGLTFHPPAGEDEDDDAPGPLSHRLAKAREDDDDVKEDIRRLYVAVTRHEDHLILVGADWRKADGGLQDGDSYLARIDKVLGVTAALARGQHEIPYGDGRFAAAVERLIPGKAEYTGRTHPAGEDLLATSSSGAELAEAVAELASGEAGDLPRVGPLPAGRGRVDVGVTALNDFLQCPMLYRWRHELRLPREFEAGPQRRAPAEPGEPAAARLDAATMGTLFHRCMELVDFSAGADEAGLGRLAEGLVARAASEMELGDSADLPAVAAELADMLRRFRGQELWSALAGARRVFRELDFVMDCPPATLTGQIDLIYQDAAGTWRIVDYKSDRVEGEELADHARRYELQMLLYAAAAGRHFDKPPASATLYFLRPAAAHVIEITPAALAETSGRASALAAELIASRRGGGHAQRRSPACAVCPYGPLCGGGRAGGEGAGLARPGVL